jgi:WD40 repeat protein
MAGVALLALAPVELTSAPVTAITFSPDGSVLAAASGNAITFVSSSERKIIRRIACGSARASAIAFHPDGVWLAVGGGVPGETGAVRMLNWRQETWLGSTATNTDLVTGVAFSPDGKALASASADKTAAVYRIETGANQLSPSFSLAGHSAGIQAVAFSPDGAAIVTASIDRSLKVWSATDGNLQRSLGQHTDAVLALAFRPLDVSRPGTPPYCASGGDEGAVRVWQPTIGRMVRIVRGYEGSVLAIAFAPDGGSFFSAGTSGVIRRIDSESDEELGRWQASTDWVYCLAVSPDGKSLAAGDWSGQIHWFAIDGRKLSLITSIR